MKQIIILLLATGLSLNSNAQFVIMNPGVPVNTVEDIKTDTNGHVVFGTDNGILVYRGGSWLHFDLSNGLRQLDVKAIGMYDDGFFYSTINRRLGNCNYISLTDTAFNAQDTFNFISAININTTGDTLYGTDSGQVYINPNINPFSGHLSFGPLGYVTDIGQLHSTSGTVDFHVIATNDKAVIYQVSTSLAVIVSTATSPIPSNNILSNTIQGAVTYDGTNRGLYIVDFSNYPTFGTTIMNTSNTPLPSDTIAAIAVSDTNIFIGTPNGLAMYFHGRWYKYDTTNSNIPSNQIARLAVDTNSLWICIKNGAICRFDFSNITSEVPGAQLASNTYLLYPNPANDYIQLDLATLKTGRLSLYDMDGNEVTKTDFDEAHQKIDIHQFADGIYIYRITGNDGVQICTGSLVVKH